MQKKVCQPRHKKEPDAGCRYRWYPEKQDSARFISDFAHAQKKEEKQGSQDPEHG
jgi:hypothetical protein